jgi:ABC-type nitrate/sulfonate/bicarbonate transport system ATPase subunit
VSDAGAGIRVEGIVKLFPRRTENGDTQMLRALDEVSVVIPPRQFVTIIGPSGCGKTTLLRMIGGLVAPSAGTVFVDDRPVRGPGPERAMVFQQPALMPWANVLANVAYGLKLRGVDREQREARALEMIELVGLAGFHRALPRELSGGMQQRVGLARALVVDPSYLLMDEPFGSLDEITRRVMQAELLSIWSRQQKTAVFVTHSVDEAVLLSDRIIVLTPRPGRIAHNIVVDLPRPRGHEMEKSPEFLHARETVWDVIGQWSTPSASGSQSA